ncbi:conserved Plasmodium protein, unknown function [Plasmodium knowlesi strain H]|uniref:TRUD domain-containing protein n=3 Tax=Plasmodium knowlesi TaxID=5850 RepID=A0A5K1V435_PLAKH|nr:U2 snRNA/tRNA pseudouridine synthase, putative [Plasmodium knowlesi strain H]OTN68253.1 Uncharacterized protein PKNOH_S03335500 [Plasmodium knowlesi]CAA9987252.1 U2 snRNA/tRNA pseudouridine synthase, putative [Plasmodium knowlesi strain H]SBO24025.1 conserved Plasmodium protein, unknown function [Plasmodium knowlesi strain H]SBO26034.1 conserved Plasmodium protein, unknown function [Plasmodium knowlesi strain H]VVS76726.1 U2 snRNA/tRNA pseudouridine synthase, putative [Plasmodium knowlesi s|eukprot:XP_002261874.1 hypothetical protein, conserved in Plasmodium species [Plasmodium knowlesi strain H]
MTDTREENFPFAKNHGIDYLFRKNLHSMGGIEGKIKTIYEDFHVHEITKSNNILHLDQLIHREKINQIILQNEEDERENLIRSISKTELHLDVIAKYVNKNNVKTFQQFLTLLHDIYMLKMKSQAGELPGEATRDLLKKVSIPYCLFTHLDEMPASGESHLNENGDATRGEESLCSDDLRTERNKAARRNIHNVIKQYYPFLLTETKNLSQTESVLFHGNILQGNENRDNNSVEFIKEEKADIHISAIQIYPSFNCLKTILPQDIFNKLKGNAKKSRFSQNDELENVICQKLDQMEEKEKIKKLPEQFRQFYREENSPEESNIAKGFSENKRRKIQCDTFSHSSDGNCTGGVNKKGQGEQHVEVHVETHVETHVEAEGRVTTANLHDDSTLDISKNRAQCADPPKETTTTYDEEGIPPYGHVSPSSVNKRRDTVNTDCKEINHEEESENSEGENFLDKLNHHRKRKSEQKKGKKYLHFNLYKENKDICEVLHKIKINLKKKNGDISYCGIKDKRGITVQRFCIHKAKKFDLFKLIMGGDSDSRDRGGDKSGGRGGSSPWCNNVFVSNLSYRKKKLSLGDLKGNFFKVLIRGVEDTSEEKFCALANNFKKTGFVNYFGHQRFGSKKIKNYEIGICILKKNYKLALFHVIENTGLEFSKKSRLIEYLNELDGTNRMEEKGETTNRMEEKGETTNRMEDKGETTNRMEEKGEVPILTRTNDKSHARKDEKDYRAEADATPQIDENAAVPPSSSEKKTFFKKKKEKKMNGTTSHTNAKEEQNKIPKEISEIINSIPSHSHVEKTILFSLKNDNKFKNAFMNLSKDIFSLFIHSAQSLIFNILADIRMNKYGFGVVVGDLVESNPRNEQVVSSDDCTENDEDESGSDEAVYETNVTLVTNENISKYDIYDVVLPLPGDKNFLFPPNLIEEYKSVLSSLHLSLDDFRSEKNFFSAPGGYRKVVVKPCHFKSLFIKSDAAGEGKIPFIRSDLCRLMEQEGAAANGATNSVANPAAITRIPDEIHTHITFVQSDAYHEHLIKEVPNYRTTASVFLTCSLPKSSYITVALLEVLNS